MDLLEILEAMKQISNRGDAEGGRGDYEDFTIQFQNAMNHHGAGPDELELMLSRLSPERVDQMEKHSGGSLTQTDPNIRNAHAIVSGALRNRR